MAANLDIWLNRLASIAVIVIAATALYMVAMRQSSAAPSSGYQSGEELDTSKLPITERTLIIATRSGCHFCTDSMPFYRSLSGIDIIWIAIGESALDNRRYLEGYGLSPKVVIPVEASGLDKITGTPTAILVDSEGRVVEAWAGKLSAAAEAEVLSKVKGA